MWYDGASISSVRQDEGRVFALLTARQFHTGWLRIYVWIYTRHLVRFLSRLLDGGMHAAVGEGLRQKLKVTEIKQCQQKPNNKSQVSAWWRHDRRRRMQWRDGSDLFEAEQFQSGTMKQRRYICLFWGTLSHVSMVASTLLSDHQGRPSIPLIGYAKPST